MKILVVGGTSSVGRALKPVLSVFSEVITAGRNDCDVTVDIKQPMDEIVFPDDIDAVIHAAAHFGGKTPEEIFAAENLNVLGTIKLCHAAVQSGVKHFVLISSIFSCLTEKSPFYSIYALSKRHAEEVSRLFCSAHSLPLSILRLSQIYGSADSFRVHQPFFYSIIDNAEKGEEVALYGAKDALRNYIHVEDAAEIIGRVVKNKVEGVFACQYPANLTYSQIARAAFKAFNKPENVKFLKEKADIQDNIFELDDSLYKKIGFYPQITIEDGMNRIALHRANQT